MLGEYLRRAQRPLVAVRPEGVTPARIDHQRDVGPDRLARARDNLFVFVAPHATEGTPPELERPEPLLHKPLELVGQRLRLAHEDRGIRTDALEIPAAQEPSDGLARRLTEQV